MSSDSYRTGVFISYSHEDREWVDRLEIVLKPYLGGESFDVWDDSDIRPGQKWSQEIDRALSKARVAVLLVSPDFLASDFISKVELPEILRRAGQDLTVFWIPIRPSAYEITPLASFQAASDPGKPLAALSRTQREAALVKIAREIASAMGINAIGNAFRIIDQFTPEIEAFVARQPEPKVEKVYALRAEQVDQSIRLVDPGGSRELITAQQFDQLNTEVRQLIRAYEAAMKDLFDRWTELKPKRNARDGGVREDARDQSEQIRGELCAELSGLLGFFESMGLSLQDHYHHVRYICSQPSA
ncbi:hypothetical protein AYO38_05610 [bacterium SCGC AG-212-C10]|nr:hypothetical protein AYO38_05610 [bacterium SCGC AG-212-C10]